MTHSSPSLSRLQFPFSAVTGQSTFKLALILAAINPRIGGVLISGPRGSAKSTLARAMTNLLPIDSPLSGKEEGSSAPFVTLPLGAAEESVIGAVNLEQVLQEKQFVFQEGLLAKAHRGILYVDEVNLLPDHLVDLLLDVSATGVNVVEREGVSHTHDARFMLLGTMNPDEGELRPQLQDRFGLAVNLTQPYSVKERVCIVQQREQFDNDPSAFIAQYEQAQRDLRSQIAQARVRLAQVSCSEQWREKIATRCLEENVDGVRADIVWCRAAMAHAAWEQRDTVAESDIAAVEELVLAHRRQAPSNTPPSSPPSTKPPSSSPYSRPPEKDNASKNFQPDASQTQNSHHQNESNHSDQVENAAGDWGGMDAEVRQSLVQADDSVVEKIRSLYGTLFVTSNHVPVSTKRSLAGRQKGHSQGWRQRTHRQPLQTLNNIHWLSTLLANVGRWPLRCLRYRPQRTSQSTLHLCLLDTSASTLQNDGVDQAKSALLSISQNIYARREQLMVMGFGNQRVDVLLPQRRAPKALQQWFDTLSVGGGTPLRDAIFQAYQFQQRQQQCFPDQKIVTYIVTDGRTSQAIDDLRLLGEVVVIDIETSAVKRGKAEKMAHALQGHYLSLAA
ncbi:ATP-binding protein [Eionea flava]